MSYSVIIRSFTTIERVPTQFTPREKEREKEKDSITSNLKLI